MTIHIFYHSADLDGHCSGALIKHRFPEAVLHPINYGEPFPWDIIKPEDTVYMVDFSLQPFEEMLKLHDSCHLVWCDHHKSAISEYDGKYHDEYWAGKREIGKAACELTYEYLYPGDPLPDSIRLLSLYDTWTHDDKRFYWDEDIEPFQCGMKTAETDPSKNWDYWEWFFFVARSATNIIHLKEDGGAIMKYLHRRYETELESRGFKMSWEGYNCLVINSDPYIANYMTRSKAFEGCDLAVNFCWSKVGWIVNLRASREEIDCSAIAKIYGGGGHRGSAGMTLKELPFEVIA